MEEAIGDYARRRRRDAFEKWECGNDRELWIPSKSSSQNSIILSFQPKKKPKFLNEKTKNQTTSNEIILLSCFFLHLSVFVSLFSFFFFLIKFKCADMAESEPFLVGADVFGGYWRDSTTSRSACGAF